MTLSHFNAYAEKPMMEKPMDDRPMDMYERPDKPMDIGATPNSVDARPLDTNEKMNVSWKHLEKPLHDVFADERANDKFLDILPKFSVYDRENNVVSVSMYDLYRVCVVVQYDLNEKKSLSDSQRDACTAFIIKVAENVLGSDELIARIDAKQAAEEEEHADDIYKITAQSQNEKVARNEFGQKLRDYVINKYCVRVEKGRDYINCRSQPRLTCETVENTKNLERDVSFVCSTRNWAIYDDEKTGEIIITLRH